MKGRSFVGGGGQENRSAPPGRALLFYGSATRGQQCPFSARLSSRTLAELLGRVADLRTGESQFLKLRKKWAETAVRVIQERSQL